MPQKKLSRRKVTVALARLVKPKKNRVRAMPELKKPETLEEKIERLAITVRILKQDSPALSPWAIKKWSVEFNKTTDEINGLFAQALAKAEERKQAEQRYTKGA